MDKKLFAQVILIGTILLLLFFEADKIRDVVSTGKTDSKTEQTAKAAESPKITRSDAETMTKNLEVEEDDKEEIKGVSISSAQNENGKSLIEDVPLISQLPELQRGCEVTSLAMLLQHEGISADKMVLATQIHKLPFRDENYVRSNPYDGFVGDIYSFDNSGYGVYHGPVAQLAEKYLPGKIKDATGQKVDTIYSMIDSGSPVWVITNSTFAPLPESEFTVWETNSGTVKITYKEHSVVVVGYDQQNVYINDPLSDTPYKPVPRKAFEQAWIQMGSQAIGIME